MGNYNQSKGACSCVWNTCCLIVYHDVCCADRDSERPLLQPLPLSQPFPILQNFLADVEADLKKGLCQLQLWQIHHCCCTRSLCF